MTAHIITTFSGIFPRLPDSLLPERAASDAKNCDFAYGELRPFKAPFTLTSLSNAARSLYTEDGLRFFSWTTDVNAVRSPVIGDTFRRVYFTTPTDFRVGRADEMQTNGGEPPSSYRVGVPKPTAKPKLESAGTVIPDNLALEATFFYEAGGVKYQEGPITLTEVEPDKVYSFVPPDRIGAVAGASDGQITITGVWNANGVSESGAEILENVWGGSPTKATILSMEAVSISGVGTVYGDYVTDTAGNYHEIDALYSMAKWGTLSEVDSGSSSDTTATPDGAFPALYVIGKDDDKGTEAFAGYTSNSSFVEADQKVKLVLTKDETDTEGKRYLVTLTFPGTEAGYEDETRAYVYTLVNTYGEEGPPSPPELITAKMFDQVNVTVTIPANSDGYAPFKEVRLYRTLTGTNGQDYFYVTALPCVGFAPGEYVINDGFKAAELNEILSSTYYYPPDPTLVGLTALPNGIHAAWKGNEVHFSEAYRPHAYNPNNRKTLPHNVVGLIAHGSGCVVVTTAFPYLVSGVSPDAMSEVKIEVPQAGVSKHAIASVDGFVVYASNDGLVVVSGGAASLKMSQAFFTREVWRSRYGGYLSTMRLAVHDGMIVGYSDTGSFAPFCIRLDEANGTMTTLPDFTAVAHAYLPQTDGLYTVAGSTVYQFGGGSAWTLDWTTRESVSARPVNYGAFQTVLRDGTLTVYVYADGNLVKTKAVGAGATTFRGPSGFKATRWKVRVQGTGTLRELRIAGVPLELAGV